MPLMTGDGVLVRVGDAYEFGVLGAECIDSSGVRGVDRCLWLLVLDTLGVLAAFALDLYTRFAVLEYDAGADAGAGGGVDSSSGVGVDGDGVPSSINEYGGTIGDMLLPLLVNGELGVGGIESGASDGGDGIDVVGIDGVVQIDGVITNKVEGAGGVDAVDIDRGDDGEGGCEVVVVGDNAKVVVVVVVVVVVDVDSDDEHGVAVGSEGGGEGDGDGESAASSRDDGNEIRADSIGVDVTPRLLLTNDGNAALDRSILLDRVTRVVCCRDD
jgi:hypothetical protein